MIKRNLIAVLALGVLAACSAETEAPEIVLQEQPELDSWTVQLAETAFAEERYNDSAVIVQRVLARDPDNPRALLIRAELLLARGSTTNAEAAFAGLVEEPEVSARALQGRGIANLLMGRNDRALRVLTEAVELDPSLWRAWNALGAIHDGRDEFADAEAAYERALAQNDDSAAIYNNRGFSRLLQGDGEAAINDFNEALAIDSDFAAARMNLRLAYAWRGMYVHALSGTSHEEREAVLNNTGYVAMLRGDLGSAENYLNQAMTEKASFNRTAWRNITYLNDIRLLEEEE